MTRKPNRKQPKVVERSRLEAADDFCWLFIIALHLGAFECVDKDWRKYLGDEFMKWAELARRASQRRDALAELTRLSEEIPGGYR